METKTKPVSKIKNKIKRNEVFLKTRKAKNKSKKRLNKDENEEKCPPKTLETMRVYDKPLPEEILVFEDLLHKYDSYFNLTSIPNIAITTSYHPFKKTTSFCRDLAGLIPSAKFYIRKKTTLNTLLKKAVDKGFTDLIFVNDDRKSPSSLMISHLPHGPTVFFKILSFKLVKEFKHRKMRRFPENPEVVLNNFTTPLGHLIGKMFATLFPQTPDFVDRRIVTFHNQRDYIFFRHHRYEFKNGEKVALRELGPRFTLRLQYVQKGLFNPQNKEEYAWIFKRHQMEQNRRKFFM